MREVLRGSEGEVRSETGEKKHWEERKRVYEEGGN